MLVNLIYRHAREHGDYRHDGQHLSDRETVFSFSSSETYKFDYLSGVRRDRFPAGAPILSLGQGPSSRAPSGCRPPRDNRLFGTYRNSPFSNTSSVRHGSGRSRLAEDALKRAYQLYAFITPDDALAALTANQIDVLVLDQGTADIYKQSNNLRQAGAGTNPQRYAVMMPQNTPMLQQNI
jgi:hypothetical protein